MKRKSLYARAMAWLGGNARPVAMRQQRSRRRSTLTFSRKWMLALVAVLAVALWLLLDNRWYLMGDDVQVTGTPVQTTLREVAIASELLGWHSFWLRPAAAAQRIVEKVPAVVDAQVECKLFPAACVIVVTERQPALVWIAPATTYWADSAGKLFPAQGDRANLPHIKGPLPGPIDEPLPMAVLGGIHALMALGVPKDALEYHLQRGLVWSDAEGRRVAFGTGTDMKPRWKMYQMLVEHLQAENIFPWVMDVRFPANPTYSLERSW